MARRTIGWALCVAWSAVAAVFFWAVAVLWFIPWYKTNVLIPELSQYGVVTQLEDGIAFSIAFYPLALKPISAIDDVLPLLKRLNCKSLDLSFHHNLESIDGL